VIILEKLKIGISSCLIGEKVRYDDSHKRDSYTTETLGQYFKWVPVCPEVEYGLPVPREPMHLVGTVDSPRLVTTFTGVDHTEGMLKWAEKKLKGLENKNLCGFIFKSKSPSSGIGGVKIYSPSGILSQKGTGIFGGAFKSFFPIMPVIDDKMLHNLSLRENFIKRVFIYNGWKELVNKGGSVCDLITFHTEQKLLILSHSPKHYKSLGRLIADAKKFRIEDLQSKYIALLMDGLSLLATVKKNINVLLHIIGYFKNHLSPDDKSELLEAIENYHKGFVPLIVPITLIKHYVRKFDDSYLKKQYYLNPHPIELMLRNHV
jgi:uncharacterized protein YbgA (DUF1722 family)/uncharacterized protein YbbK (DUF523 family)